MGVKPTSLPILKQGGHAPSMYTSHQCFKLIDDVNNRFVRNKAAISCDGKKAKCRLAV